MEKNGKPFFTIITSTLNVIETIERCVKSVAEQTFRNYEHIIVDGASTDGTAEFLNSRKELFSVLISEPDTGIYNAWNKALKYARGESAIEKMINNRFCWKKMGEFNKQVISDFDVRLIEKHILEIYTF